MSTTFAASARYEKIHQERALSQATFPCSCHRLCFHAIYVMFFRACTKACPALPTTRRTRAHRERIMLTWYESGLCASRKAPSSWFTRSENL